jgi:hypothetical protein
MNRRTRECSVRLRATSASLPSSAAGVARRLQLRDCMIREASANAGDALDELTAQAQRELAEANCVLGRPIDPAGPAQPAEPHARRRLSALLGLLLVAPARAEQADPCDRIEAQAQLAVGDRAHPVPPSEARRGLEDVRELLAVCTDARVRALWYFWMAETMKLQGDVDADEMYAAAVREAPSSAVYEVHWLEYTRNFRGPYQNPLIVESEIHAADALRKLEKDTGLTEETRLHLLGRIRKNQTVLYERDGVPLRWSDHLTMLPDAWERRPLVFLSSTADYARALDDFGQFDFVRDQTEAALFAGAPTRLGRPLHDSELRSLIRPRDGQFQTTEKLRLHYRELPVIEASYSYADLQDGQNTNYYTPGHFNDVRVSRWSLAAERVFASRIADLLLRVEGGMGERWGLIEFQGSSGKENADFIGATGVASRFLRGGNSSYKASLVINAGYSEYRQQLHSPDRPEHRDLEVVAATFHLEAYSGETYGRAFEPRSSEIVLGVLFSQEGFGQLEQNRDDLFGGFALRGLPYLDFARTTGRLDLTVQAALLSSSHSGRDPSGLEAAPTGHRQVRVPVTILYRLVDFENEPTLSALRHRLGPLRLSQLAPVLQIANTTAVKGPDDYEALSVTGELFAKTIADFSTGDRYLNSTLLLSGGFGWHRYYHLAKDVTTFTCSVRLGGF